MIRESNHFYKNAQITNNALIFRSSSYTQHTYRFKIRKKVFLILTEHYHNDTKHYSNMMLISEFWEYRKMMSAYCRVTLCPVITRKTKKITCRFSLKNTLSIYKKTAQKLQPRSIKKKNRTSRVIVLSVQILLFCYNLKHHNLNILYILPKKNDVRINFHHD